jgi:hypothetical protein
MFEVVSIKGKKSPARQCTQRHEAIRGKTLDVVKGKEDAYAGRQAYGKTNDLVNFGETPTIRMKLDWGDVQCMQKGHLKRGKRKPQVESLYNHSVH